MKSSGVSQRLAWLVCATLAGAPLFIGPLGPTAVLAQNAAHLSSQQLDSLTAPIALYPDALLAQVLMATTFPQDVQAAAEWSKANPNAKGDDAVKAVASQPWDPSVQSLVAFPQVLATMAQKPEWVQQIGNAFLAQPNDVMDSVQRLRVQAQKAGNLKSNEQQKVVVQPASSTSTTQTIVIEPANPQVVYVPTYNPTVVYGTWPYPAYPPVYMPPPPGYAMASAFVGGLAFGAGVAVANSLWGGVNWGNNSVNVNVNRYNNINVNNRINANGTTANWNSNANYQRRQNYNSNVNNANLNAQRNQNLNAQRDQYRGYDQSRQQAMQTLQNRTGENMSGNAQQRYQGIQEGGRANGNGANAANGNRANELNNRTQNGAQNANRGNELNNRAQNGAQNANRTNDLNNRAQNTNRDNALRGAGDGGNTRLDQQRGQQSRQAMQGGGGFNGGGQQRANFGGGGGGGGGARFGGGGGGERHFGRR